MGKLGRFLVRTAKQIAQDPRVREKAAEVYEKEVKPRAREAWRKGKPKLEEAKDDLRKIARESDPRKDPKEFARRVKQRFTEKRKGGD